MTCALRKKLHQWTSMRNLINGQSKKETYKNICLEREARKRQEAKIREERLLKLKEEEES